MDVVDLDALERLLATVSRSLHRLPGGAGYRLPLRGVRRAHRHRDAAGVEPPGRARKDGGMTTAITGQVVTDGRRVSAEATVFGWHFLRDDSTRDQDGVPIDPGATETWDGPLSLCESGLHFCVRPMDALRYAQGALIRRVRLSGSILQPDGSDKGCATVRTELWRADVSALLHEFACDVAEQTLDRVAAAGGSVDPRSREAIATKRRWLRGEASAEELAAARAAAGAAAGAAARAAARAAAKDAALAAAGAAAKDAALAAAGAAAWDAAGAAAGDAAWAAAWAAAGAAAKDAALAAAKDAALAAAGAAAGAAAWDAAGAAAGAAQNDELEKRLFALGEKQ